MFLAQEIIGDINKKNKHTNVVIKLGKKKAYDRVSWIYLTKVLRKFGFSKEIVDMIWGLVSNNWYSVVINDKSFSFFKSTRGLKQGDSLSTTLFIIAAEVLFSGLNMLNENPDFMGYGMPKWSSRINHLVYPYDTILFGSGDKTSIWLTLKVLSDYEKQSGQKVNKSKCAFFLHDNSPLCVAIRLRRLTEIKQGNFSFIYFGCLVYYGRGKI